MLQLRRSSTLRKGWPRPCGGDPSPPLFVDEVRIGGTTDAVGLDACRVLLPLLPPEAAGLSSIGGSWSGGSLYRMRLHVAMQQRGFVPLLRACNDLPTSESRSTDPGAGPWHCPLPFVDE